MYAKRLILSNSDGMTLDNSACGDWLSSLTPTTFAWLLRSGLSVICDWKVHTFGPTIRRTWEKRNKKFLK